MAFLPEHSAYEALLAHLAPSDHANLRLACRSWKALVDRSLSCLHPFAITSTGFASGVTSLVCKSLLQSSSVRHHAVHQQHPAAALYAMARQFTALHTLEIDCASKGCSSGFAALPLMLHLRRLRLCQFPFTDDCFADGLAASTRLQVLHLECLTAMLQVRSLRHLSGLRELRELVVKPRGFINVPPKSSVGIATLSGLTRLTQLQLVTALRPLRSSAAGDAASPPLPDLAAAGAHVPAAAAAGGAAAAAAAAVGAAGGHVYFDAPSTAALSDSLAALKGLEVLRLAGVASLPPAVSGLSRLRQLSLERVGSLQRPVVASLSALQHLSAVTLITAADLADLQPQQQQQWELQHDIDADGPAAAAAAAAAGAAAAVSHDDGSAAELRRRLGLWLPLMLLPQLQEVVVGRVFRGHSLNLTGPLTTQLQPGPVPSSSSSSGCNHSQQQQQQEGVGSGGWFLQGLGGRRFQQQEGAAVTAYVCPQQWSQLSERQGLSHLVIEARGWHSAAVTARFPSAAAAVGSFMTWHAVAPLAAAAGCDDGALHAARSSGGGSSSSSSRHTCSHPGAAAAAAAAASPRGTVLSAASSGAVGVFVNHPAQGGYLPGMPLLLVLALRPSMAGLGQQQRQLVADQLVRVQQQQQLGPNTAGLTMPGGGGAAGAGPAAAAAAAMHSHTPAHRLMLAQLQASCHPSKVLLVLGLHARLQCTSLELTVDQSWPPAVLSSLAQLANMKQLRVLKLDFGRQDPPADMWPGLAGLTRLRWLCLRWLDALPVACLAPLTGLVVLQLKAISRPPGAAELAEVISRMPSLSALAVEGGLLDQEGDWLRDTAGLLRHGRWTSSWVEHTLCRQRHLQVLGSLTAALLMTVALNSPRLPEMLASAMLAAAVGSVFVAAVAAALLSLLLQNCSGRGDADSCRRSWQFKLRAATDALAAANGAGASGSSPAAVADPGAAFRRLRYLSLRRCTLTHTSSSLSSRLWQLSGLSAQLPPVLLHSQLGAVLLGLLLWPLAAAGALSRIAAASGGGGSWWQQGWTSAAANPASNGRGFWAALFSLGRRGGGGGRRRGRGRFAGWSWYWDSLCGTLQGLANRVEVVIADQGSALVGLVREMPALRFLDVTWLNLEPWELQQLVSQGSQLQYLGLGKQQVALVMSQEALLGRSCSRGRTSSRGQGGRALRLVQQQGTSAGGAGAAGGQADVVATPLAAGLSAGFSGAAAWLAPFASLACWWPQQQAATGRGGLVSDVSASSALLDCCEVDESPLLLLVEAAAGFDELIEREIMAADDTGG